MQLPTSSTLLPYTTLFRSDAVVKVFGSVRGPFSMLLHSPKLAERLLPLVTFFRDESVVETPLRTIAVLTAVREQASARSEERRVGEEGRARGWWCLGDDE